MSVFDVLQRFGTAALTRFTAALLLFLLVHLLRIPLVLIARALEVFLRRINRYVARQVSQSAGPVNDFFADVSGFREAHDAHS